MNVFIYSKDYDFSDSLFCEEIDMTAEDGEKFVRHADFESQLAALREELSTMTADRDAEKDMKATARMQRDKVTKRLADAERRNVQLSESALAYLNLREKIRAMGTPPHSDYWHQSIHAVESDLRSALNPNPEAASHEND